MKDEFNHAGQSHLYLANNKETAIREISEGHNSLLLWYQEFDVEKEDQSENPVGGFCR